MRAEAVLAAIAVATVTAARKCEKIHIPQCSNIGYNYTSYPNMYGHVKQEDAGLEVQQFYPLVKYGCFKHLQFFLCTLYTPICQENYDMPILPCKELCLQARDQCSPIMKKYDIRWPQTLSCDSLPSRDEQATTVIMCAAPPDTPSTKISDNCDCTCAPPFVFQKGSSVAGVADCAYPCSTNILSSEEKGFVRSWMTVGSIACIVASTFTLLTFLIEPDRFRYPERPIFMLAFCQLMVAIGIVIRVGLGHEAIACSSNTVNPDGVSTLCFIVFLLTYFFGMAASVWWMLLSLAWVLTARFKWANEAIASYWAYFHIIGWTLPAIQTGMVLAFSAVDGDSVTGLCFVGNTNIAHLRLFVIAPLVAYFIIKVFLLIIAFIHMWRIRSCWVSRRMYPGIEGVGRLTRYMYKIVIFSILYALPALLTILVFFFEQEHRPQWEQAAMCPCLKSANEADHSVLLWLSLLKIASFVLLSCATAFWVLSPKTFASWRAKICCGTPVRDSSTAGCQPAAMIFGTSDCSGRPPVYFNSIKNGYGRFN